MEEQNSGTDLPTAFQVGKMAGFAPWSKARIVMGIPWLALSGETILDGD